MTLNDTRTPIKGVIFDLDGTLLNTLSAIGTAFNEALSEQGWETHSISAYEKFIGGGVRVAATRALPEAGRSDRVIDALVARQREIHHEIWRNHVSIYEGIEPLLAYLQAHAIPTAVLTNKDEPAAIDCLDHCFPHHSFAAIHGRRDNVPLKPDPTSAHTVLRAMQCRPETVAMLGDTEVDLETAKAAGMQRVAVTWGFRSERVLLDTGCDILLHDPLTLIGFLPSS